MNNKDILELQKQINKAKRLWRGNEASYQYHKNRRTKLQKNINVLEQEVENLLQGQLPLMAKK